ncbi:phosphoribosylanthranilate isomerase [Bacillus sp. FJAT-42315]|uniref:phosphoribosylanthranilate isomerase n=1 Tax=Bacillus sp. FJAT-42315 TaxID=2014077 RepID=UPI000C2431F5|nr:phosphoribosylanthranilate isomerase [Bacillus sp. FJAT-42315]
MKVKICGIQDVDIALHAQQIGTDYIGFVFAKSKRQVSAEQAAAISDRLQKGPLKVGVFVNEDVKRVEEIAEAASLDIIQLHGDESPEYARKLTRPVMKAFSYSPQLSMKEVLAYPADLILLDSAKGPYRGGNGTTFNWSLLTSETFDRTRLILAGGLHPDNVQEAITMIQPAAVDVSSGVETNGVKDWTKMKAFIDQAKGVGQ